MPDRVFTPEFREEYENTRYPFADDCSLTSDTGLLLPVNAFLDMVLHAYGAVGAVHLARVTVAVDAVELAFADSVLTEVATAAISLADVPDNLPLVDVYSRDAGLIVSESIRLAAFAAWPLGDHRFTAASAALVPSVVVPMPAVGVRAFRLDDGSLVSGDVWLVGDDGVVIRDDNEESVRIDIVGDPLFKRRLCDPLGKFASPNFVKTVNGQGPDIYGNIDIAVSDLGSPTTIVRCYPDGGTLHIETAGSRRGG